jgi:hypothetical protein
MRARKQNRLKSAFKKYRIKHLLALLLLVTATASFAIIHLPQDDHRIVSTNKPLEIHSTPPVAQENPQGQRQLTPDITTIEDASSEINGEWFGLCKKKSVHTVDDFRQIVENDPVLLSYYSGFDWNSAQLGRLQEETYAFVAHRKGTNIQKTAKPIKLPKGDGYISDGVRTARTYCCNDIVLAPSAGVPKKELPEFPSLPVMGLETTVPAPLIPLIGATNSFSPYPLPESPPAPKAVPEPDTLLLFGFGLLTLLFLRKNTKR